MARRALAALALAAVLVTSPAHSPCCVRVTPYHIQALAQRMAQRFQALEYRAQDLRGVFAAFQAVHGNATHRLRFLEAEHAHLSEMVSRLDSRVQVLENEKRMDEFRQREFYRRGERDAAVRTTVDLLKSPARLPFMMRRRRQADSTELPHIFVHLDQTKDSSEDIELKTDISSSRPVFNPTEDSTSVSESVTKNFGFREQDTYHFAPSTVGSEPTSSSPENSQKHTTPLSRVLATTPAEQPSQMPHDAPARDSATTPTPLWQLEETASALLDVMSAGDDDVGDANVPNDASSKGVSYWSPANETDSLEKLFNSDQQQDAPKTSLCPEESTGRCSTTETSKLPQTLEEHVSFVVTSTESPISSTSHDIQFNNKSSNSNKSVSFVLSGINASSTNNTEASARSGDAEPRTESEVNSTSESSAVKDPNTMVKIPNCKLKNPVGEIPIPSDNKNNSTNVLDDFGNNAGPLLDLFTSGTEASPGPPDGGGGGGEASAVPTCGPAGCEAELSDAELQEALKELDALLQRPASASPPDPEKVLLKRALTLALGALERTSDACLKLVNFTADAFEGLAASEA